jgi:hypothetical protein
MPSIRTSFLVAFHNALFVDFDLDADELEPKIPAQDKHTCREL